MKIGIANVGSDTNVKSGFAKGKQRYKCKACGYHFTIENKSTAKPLSLKKQAFGYS